MSRHCAVYASIVVALLACLAPDVGLGQTRPYSVDEIVDLLVSGVSQTRIIELTQEDCVGFQVKPSTETRLRKAGADDRLIASLRTVCYAGCIVEVTTEPSDAEVWIDGHLIGKAPVSYDAIPTSTLIVEARVDDWRSSVPLDIGPRQLIRVHFQVPADTLDWPVPRSQEQIAQALAETWNPTEPRPSQPVAPDSSRGTTGRWILGILGLIGGGVAGYAVNPDSAVYAAGGAALGGILGLWLGNELDKSAQGARLRDYHRAVTDYPVVLAEWQAEMAKQRAEWLERVLPEVMEEERKRVGIELNRVRTENERIKALNEALASPTVRVDTMR